MLFPIKDYNPTQKTAYITIIFIVLNVIVFCYQAYFSPEPFQYHLAKSSLIPYEITHFKNIAVPVHKDSLGRTHYLKRETSPFLAFITSIFMHGSIMHLLGNMLFLWIFGNNIEDNLGKIKFILFYFIAGIGASLIHILFNFNSTTPLIGASGAVSGIMGAYLILFPHAKVRTLVLIFIIVTFVDIPAFVFLFIWFIFQFFYSSGGDGIAWLAHVGGFLIGMAVIKMMGAKKI